MANVLEGSLALMQPARALGGKPVKDQGIGVEGGSFARVLDEQQGDSGGVAARRDVAETDGNGDGKPLPSRQDAAVGAPRAADQPVEETPKPTAEVAVDDAVEANLTATFNAATTVSDGSRPPPAEPVGSASTRPDPARAALAERGAGAPLPVVAADDGVEVLSPRGIVDARSPVGVAPRQPLAAIAADVQGEPARRGSPNAAAAAVANASARSAVVADTVIADTGGAEASGEESPWLRDERMLPRAPSRPAMAGIPVADTAAAGRAAPAAGVDMSADAMEQALLQQQRAAVAEEPTQALGAARTIATAGGPVPGAENPAAAAAAGAGTPPSQSTGAAAAAQPLSANHGLVSLSMRTAPSDPEFSGEMVARMQTLLRDGVREARLQLHPAELGRLQVTVTTDGDQARVMFLAETGAAKDAIEQAMPRLREALQQSGLQLAQSDVGQRDFSGGGLGAGPGSEGGGADVGADGSSQADLPAEAAVAAAQGTGAADGPSGRIDTYI